jgi:hypothetical protein
MIPSDQRAVPAKSSKKRDVIVERGPHGPMSQQNAAGSHGHEMHPQKLVRLVGCHDNAAKHESENPLN